MNMARGRIAVLSPLAAENAIVRCVCGAGTFARGGRNAFVRRYTTMGRHM